MEKLENPKRVLVTGATGYVGGRLVPKLLESGYQVRVMVRDPRRLEGRAWANQIEIIQGDVFQPETLLRAMENQNAVYYLIHSMNNSPDFHQRDLMAAKNFSQAAKNAHVNQIIYLGGLGDPEADLSEHLRSRQETGDALREAGVPVTEFRAAVIVGSGSLSFEMIRYLTERVPVMICPKWVYTRAQPIAITDVLDYLVKALQTTGSKGEIIEIGGSRVLTYGDMMMEYAELRGLRRIMLPVPVLTPRLSSYWVHWVTPVPASIARPLIDGLKNEVIVRTEQAKNLFPDIKPLDYQTAVMRALGMINSGKVETVWSDALVSSLGDKVPVQLTQEQGLIIEQRRKDFSTSTRSLFQIFSQLGGKRGWLAYNFAWQLRGKMDRIFGGVGLRRGRRHPTEIRVGDAIDFWRVEAVEPDRMLRLRAEMKVPGKAWLQFEAVPSENGKTTLIQTAFFDPKGLLGLLYWYSLYPIHALIFGAMVNKIGELAESLPLENQRGITPMVDKLT